MTVDAPGPVAEASEAAAGQEAGTVHNSRARITPELCTGSVGRPGWSKRIYRHRIPLAVVGTPLATRKGLEGDASRSPQAEMGAAERPV